MASHKSFTTYTPTEGSSFDLNGITFRLRPSVPGDVLLDFIAGADQENSAAMAGLIRQLMDAALLPEEKDRWYAYIRDPNNNVTLATLAEVAGFVSERMSGNPTDRQPEPFMPG